jgi:hypothetical protein
VRSGLRWCSGFALWPTLQARDAKGQSAFRSQPLREDAVKVASWIDFLVIDQPEPNWGPPDGEWIYCTDGRLRRTSTPSPLGEFRADPKNPQRSWWYLFARRVPLLGEVPDVATKQQEHPHPDSVWVGDVKGGKTSWQLRKF